MTSLGISSVNQESALVFDNPLAPTIFVPPLRVLLLNAQRLINRDEERAHL